MNDHDSSERRFWEAARGLPPRSEVPLGFERRLMAAIHERSKPDPLEFFGLAIWRAAVSSVGVMLVAGVVFWRMEVGMVNAEFSGDEIDTALLEAVDPGEESW